MKDLRVELPESVKQSLSKRFDHRKRRLIKKKAIYVINIKCPLCAMYPSCLDCPFKRFATSGAGCVRWIDDVLEGVERSFVISSINKIVWQKDDDEAVEKQFSILISKAKGLIRWV